MRTPVKISLWVAAALSLCAIVPRANAISYNFQNITANNVANAAAGVSQLSVDVTAQGANQVLFTFKNVGATAMSITDVYFDDGSLLGIASINNTAGLVNFTQGGSPPNLPGGSGINFNTTAGFLADSTSPIVANGVNPGETLGIVFNLIGGQAFADAINAINLSLANPGVDVTGGLRIGIHVQAINTGTGDSSEAFVNGGPTPGPGTTPVPDGGATVALLGLGIAALGLSRRLINR